MKIAMISSCSSIHVKKIANELVTRGHKITLYTLPNNDKLVSEFDKRIRIVKLPVKGKLGYYLNAIFIKRDLRRNPVDIINSHYVSGYGTLARLVGKHPLVVAALGSDIFEYPFKSKIHMAILKKNLSSADIITSTSNVMAEKIKEIYTGTQPVYVTPFGVDLKIFHPNRMDDNGCFEIGFIKKIEDIYGIDVLLKSYNLLRNKYDVVNSRLSIYGRGSAVGKLKKMAAGFGLGSHVSFKGFIKNEDVPEALSHLDLVCYPSTVDESFGVSVVEAMACGVPVIVSNAPGFEEVVGNSKVGLIVKKGDYDELARAMYKIYTIGVKGRRKMGIAGIERTHLLYDFKKNMDIYETILRKASR